MQGMRTIVIEEIDAHTCRHTITGVVAIKIFGIGKIAESTIVESTVKTFRALPPSWRGALLCTYLLLLAVSVRR